MTIHTKPSRVEALDNCAHLDGDTEAQSGDEFFNPWRLPASPAARQLVADVIEQFQTFETMRQVRQRKRRAKDLAIFEQTVTALICDLAHAELTGVNWIAVPRSKTVLARKSRYLSPVFGKQLPTVLDILADPDLRLIEQMVGHWDFYAGNQRTMVQAGEHLRTMILNLGLTLRDFGTNHQEETIILKAPPKTPVSSGKAVDYPETETTSRMRAEMETLNRGMEGADLKVVMEGQEVTGLTEPRRLRRVFTYGSFTSGGRLFGGFWEEMPKHFRRTALRIDGEETVELDYGQMALRLLYGEAGVIPSWTDGYLVPLPGLEGDPGLFRDGMKVLINAMLFSKSPLSRKPKDTKKLLPGFLSIQQLTEAVLGTHRPVAHLFHSGIGHHLQFLESELMVDLLLIAGDRGITALPIHDSIIVERSHEMEAKTLMEEVFHRRTGLVPVIKASTD